MLQMPQVPVKYAGQQTAYLLHNRYDTPNCREVYSEIQSVSKSYLRQLRKPRLHQRHPEGNFGTQLIDMDSEHFFPPLNAACTLSNLIMTIIVYLNRDSHSVATAKLPYLFMATAANLATTAYALLIMVPMNRKQAAIAERLKDREDEKEEKELRGLQTKWSQLNYGRAMIMVAASVSGMMGLLVHHA